MTASPSDGAGRGSRVSPRPVRQLIGALVLLLLVAACGGSTAPGSAADSPATGPTGSGPGPGAGGGDEGSRGGSPGAANDSAPIPNQLAGLTLAVAPYQVPDAPDGAGGAELRAMLGALGLRTTDVTLLVGVDRAGLLAIGRWGLPGRNADAILAAWEQAAGTGWQTLTLGAEPALSGRGPDGSRAWAVARDGVFVYVVTDDPELAAQAVAGTR